MKPVALFVTTLFFLIAGCSSASRTVTPGEASSMAPGTSAESKEPMKSIEEAVKSSKKIDGLFTVYQDTTSGSLQLVVRKDQLDKEYIYFAHTVDGVIDAGHFRGAYRDNQIFSVRRYFDRIEFVAENTGYYFDPQNALSRAARANISPALLAAEKIVATDSTSGDVLIKADELFLTEALHQVKASPNPQARPGEEFTLGQLSKGKTKYVSVKNYPLNMDVIVEYVYENPAPVAGGRGEVTDARNVSLTIQHSLIQMPENDYVPRFDDPRLGYFTQQVNDLTSTSGTPYRDLIRRWHLVKKTPGAALSEPVEPIVWWIENTTPVELRETIRDAALAWNKAFEKAGFKDAIVVKVQPDDADWDAGDIRYNVLRWTSSPTPPFGGYGPSFTNPRTGQILGADVMLEFAVISSRLHEERLFDAAALQASTPHFDPGTSFCNIGSYLHLENQFGLQALSAMGAPAVEVREYMKEFLHFLVLHEIGHTLGLNHNMKSSQLHTVDQIYQKDRTMELGLTGSVMDYPGVNFAPPGGTPAQYWTTTPGPYDHWAIEYGYSESLTDAAAEQQRIRNILARSTEPELAFGNDADDMRAPGKAIDPRVMINDLSSDAITYSIGRFSLVNDLIGKVKTKYPQQDQSYHELRTAYLVLTGQYATAASVISRYIGGVYVDRAFVGQEGATRPFIPVSLADQKRAMQALREYVFAPTAFSAPADLYDHLQMQRRGFTFFQITEDPKIHARVLSIQKSLLDHLLHPVVLARLTDTRLYGNEYPVSEMVHDLTESIFADDAGGDVNTFRQNLQLEYVNRLAAMLDEKAKANYDYPSISAALQNLKAIQKTLASKKSGNRETRAHTDHVLYVIEQAFEPK